MKKKLTKLWNNIIGININTLLLLLILMMMFGEYSRRYFPEASWGTAWHIEVIAPYVYYGSGVVAVIIIVVLIISMIARMFKRRLDK